MSIRKVSNSMIEAMQDWFLGILNMSITSGYVILAVLAVRLLLRKAPKRYSYLLWSVVAFRLICPVAWEAVFSLFTLGPFNMSAAQKENPAILCYVPQDIGRAQEPRLTTGILVANSHINPLLPSAGEAQAPVTPMGALLAAAAAVCFAGMAVMLVYSLISYVRLRRRLEKAVHLEANIWQSERVQSPFILGLIRPRIYIPYGLKPQELSYVLAHERYHLRRKDHLIKFAAFELLMLHWFNPLCWLAYGMMSRDMEMSCDEKVLSGQGAVGKAYSMTLLSIAANRRLPTPGALAFGESCVKRRIVNVLNWKKPKTWIRVTAAAVCAAAIAACATNPSVAEETGTAAQSEVFGHEYAVKEFVYDAPQFDFAYTKETAPVWRITEDGSLWSTLDPRYHGGDLMSFTRGGSLEEYTLTEENFDAGFDTAVGSMPYSSRELAAGIRENNSRAWQLRTALPDNEALLVCYLLEQRDGSVYLAEGYAAPQEPDQVAVRWLFLLERTDHCRVSSYGEQRFAAYYPDSDEYPDFSNLPVLTVSEGDILTLEVDWECDALTLIEECMGEPQSRRRHELERAADGSFTWEPARRGASGEETLCYTVLNGSQRYLFRVWMPAEGAGALQQLIYIMERSEGSGEPAAMLLLQPQNKYFCFIADSLLSAATGGTYTQEDGMLVCEADSGEVYRFEIQDGSTLIVAENSDIPETALSERDAVVGAGDVFRLQDTAEETASCCESYRMELPTGSEAICTASLSLDRKHGKFTFVYDMLSSYLPTGGYEQKDGILCCTDGGGNVYRFRIEDENTLIFLAEGSAAVTVFDERLQAPVEDGAVFERIAATEETAADAENGQ